MIDANKQIRKARSVQVIPTNVANVASVVNAFKKLGCRTQLGSSPESIRDADYVVLPGVGAFAAGMESLNSAGISEVLIGRIQSNRPTLAICLGMQLLCERSEESPGCAGLGVVAAEVKRLRHVARLPQLGWNQVQVGSGCAALQEGYAYYANSYALFDQPSGWQIAQSRYGETFVAAIESGAVLACQFHPELSGRWGLDLLDRWLARGGEQC